MKIIISIDDGKLLDLKVARLLEKYNLRGLFFIPNYCELDSEQIKRIADRHEIGGHTQTHPMDLKLLTNPQLESEIVASRGLLQKNTGQEINAFCYPRGRYNDHVIKYVKKAGYKWARTTNILNIEEPKKPFESDTSIHWLPFRTEYNTTYLKKGEHVWIDLVDIARRQLALASELPNGYFSLWLHSNEIEKHGQWEYLEEAFKIISRYVNK